MAFYDAPAIKTVQQVLENGNAGDSSPIITNVDITKTIPFLSIEIDDTTGNTGYGDFRWNTVGTEPMWDWDGTRNYSAEWAFLEFARGVRVQVVSISSVSAGTNTYDIDKIDLRKSWIMMATPRKNAAAESFRARFNSDGTQVIVENQTFLSNGAFVVVEYNGAKVQHATVTHASGSTTVDTTINKVDLKHALIFSSTLLGGSMTNEDVAVPYLTSDTNIRFEKAGTGLASTHDVFIVELPEFNIQSGLTTVTSANTQETETIKPTFSSHTLALPLTSFGAQSAHDDVAGRLDRASVRTYIDGTTLTIERSAASGDTIVPWAVLEYKERLAIRKISNYESNNDYSATTNYDVDVDAFVPEKTWHWAWADEKRWNGGSYRFNLPGTKIIDENTVNVMIGNSYSNYEFTPRFVLVEFDTGVTIQHLLDPGGARPKTIAINAVDLTRAGIFAQMIADGSADWFVASRGNEYTFNAIDEVGIDNSNNSNVYTQANIQVLEFHDAHNRVVEDNTSSANVDAAITRLDPEKTFIAGYSWQQAVTLDVDGVKRLILDATDNLNLIASASFQLDTTAYPVMIDGPSQIRVQHKTVQLTTASGTVSIDAVKTDRSYIRINGWNGNLGTTTTGGSSLDTDSLQCVASFNSSTEVAITRETTAARNVNVSLSVIEVDPFPIEQFKRRCKLTIQGSQVEADGTYPVHLQYRGDDTTLTNLPTEMFTGSGSYSSQWNGGDIRVSSDVNGTGLLPLEIVDWYVHDDPASGVADAWTRVPLQSGVDTDIYIWWHTAGYTQQVSPWLDDGAYQVWPTGEYAFVCHCSTFDVNTAGAGYWDSTSRARTPDTIEGGTFGARATSDVGVGISGFTSGSNTNIRFNSNAEVVALSDSAYTVYVVATDSGDSTYECFGIGQAFFAASQNGGPVQIGRDNGDDSVDLRFGDSDGSNVVIDLGTGSWPANTEVFIAHGQTSSPVPFGSVNGGSRTTGSFGAGPATPADCGQITMFNSKNNGDEWPGYISEVIIKTTEDGANWDTTFYNTTMNPSGFIVPGTPSGAWGHSVPVVNGLLAQYDPSTSGSLTLSGIDVQYMRDLATGFNAYKDSNFNAPSVLSGQWDSLYALQFTESSNERLALPWFPIEGSDERFIWVVAFSDTTGTDRSLVSFGSGTATEMWSVRADNSTTYVKLNNGSESVVSASGYAFSDGAAVYGIQHDGSATIDGTWMHYGKKAYTQLSSENLTSGSTNIDTVQASGEYNWLGNESVGLTTDAWDGQIAEVLIYDRDLSDTEKEEVFIYLRDKWLQAAVAGFKVIIVPSWLFQPRAGLNR